MFEIDFFAFDHNFCESLVYATGQHPEYLNSISSLFITLIGLNGLFKPNINFYIQMLYSALAVNGVTSCFYHWFNSIGWGLLDRMSMILIALSSTVLFMVHLDKFIKLDKWNQSQSKFLINLSHLFVTCYFTILLTISGLHLENVFNILFGLFLASLLVFMMIINKHKTNLHIPLQIIDFGWSGIKYISLSGIFWIGTENLCTHIWFVKYLFGHVLWHVFVSYGGYLLSLVPNYLTLKENSDHVKVNYDWIGIPYLEKY
jgi:hypothetical protein